MTAGRLLHSGDQQAPDGRGHHDTGGEVSEPLLHLLPPKPAFRKNTQAAPREVPQKGASNPQNTITPIPISLLSIVCRDKFCAC